MKIITPLAALIIAANVWAIGPAMDKEYDNKQATIINHKYDNLDNQADLDDDVTYQVSDDKAYKMVEIDGEKLVSNEWQPVIEQGYTDEYLQSEQYQTARHANQFIAKAYRRYDDE